MPAGANPSETPSSEPGAEGSYVDEDPADEVQVSRRKVFARTVALLGMRLTAAAEARLFEAQASPEHHHDSDETQPLHAVVDVVDISPNIKFLHARPKQLCVIVPVASTHSSLLTDA